MIIPNGRIKTHPYAEVRLLDFEGTQAASNWVDVTSTGTPSIADAAGYGIDSDNALQITQSLADATYLARYRFYNASGWDCSKSDVFTLAFTYPPDHLPSRQRVGSSGTLEVAFSSDGDGVFTNNLLITLGGGGTYCGLPEMGRNVFSWNVSDMTPGGTINRASIKNIRFRLNTASATDTIIIQGLWCGRRGSPVVCVVADDGWASQGLGANEMCTLANAQDIKMTLYVIPALSEGSDGSTYISESEITDIDAAGNSIAVHGTGPEGVGDLTDFSDGGYAEVAAAQAWVRARNYDWQHYAYPGGAFNADVLATMRSLGMLSARTLAGISYDAGPPVQFASRGSYYCNGTQIGGMPNWHSMNACPLNNQLTLAQVQAQVDRAIKKGESIILYGHKLGGAADSLTFTTSDFTSLMAYLARKRRDGLCDIMTIPQMHQAMTTRMRPAATR